MSAIKFYHSLRFKITLGLFIPLLAALSLFFSLQYAQQRQVLLENLEHSATNAGEIVKSSLQYGMLINDFSLVKEIMDDIAEQQGVLDLWVLDKQGLVVLATGSEGVGVTMPISDPTCRACHRYEAASRNESVILSGQQGGRVFRNVNAIENQEVCQTCHDPREMVSGVLITDLPMASMDRQLAMVRRNSLLVSAGSILVILLIVNVMMSQMVLSRLERFFDAIRQISRGNLEQTMNIAQSDEIGELARSFNRMAAGLKEKQKLERSLQQRTEELQAQAEKLAALNAIADTVSQSLDLEEILSSALGKVLDLMKLQAGWIVLRNDQSGRYELAVYQNLAREVGQVDSAGPWEHCVCPAVSGEAQFDVLLDLSQWPCAETLHLSGDTPVRRACIPLTSKDQVLGAMSLVGEDSMSAPEFGPDTSELLVSIGQQIGIAVENVRLYEELRQKEELRRQLLERVIAVQEDERKRIARELHDETSQALTSLIVRLQALEQLGSLTEVQTYLSDLKAEAARTLDNVHDLALELRPSVLDDLGLVAGLRHYCRDYEQKFRVPVDLQVVGIGSQRLPPPVETALYRIVQEALTNSARHAQAQTVSVLLEKRGSSVVVVVEDDGQGFDVAEVMGSPLRRSHLGLYGMQERASLLGGTVTIESSPGTGTAVFVEIPLNQKDGNDGEDPSSAG